MIRKAIVTLTLFGLGVILGVSLQGDWFSSDARGQGPGPFVLPATPATQFGAPSPSTPAPTNVLGPTNEMGPPQAPFQVLGQNYDDQAGAFSPALPSSNTLGSPLTSVQSSAPNIASTMGLDMGDGFFAMTNEEALNVSVYDRANRSVVNISTTSIKPESFLLNLEVEGNGSGSVFDQQGHILTNHHVISGSQKVTVTLFNGDAYPAAVVGADPDNDIAVLKINAPESVLFPVPWGDSSNLRVGQHIIAIGNPFGLERTMTTGIISSLNRQITSKTKRQIHSIIQIDAALNQGNSGGPLFNSRCELIGMNTAIATRSGDNAGIGFAIPVNTIRRVVSQLILHGRVIRPTIGILQVFETDRGLLVVNMTPGGPAERAGLQGTKIARRKGRVGVLSVEQDIVDHSQSDLIVGVDGQKVKRSDDLLGVIETKQPGDQVVLTIVRSGGNGETVQVPIQLGGAE